MLKFFAIVVFVCVGQFCFSNHRVVEWDSTRMEEKPEWSTYFANENVQGTIVIFNQQKARYYVYNKERFETPYLPASTFKIFNSLVALETGVIKNEKTVLKWDGFDRGNPNWNQNQDLKTAYKNSTVWYYQELAKKIGFKAMQKWIDECSYGNRDIHGGISDFWLKGKLRITAKQQIDFLKKLQADLLPFKPEVMKAVKAIMIEEKTDTYILRAKTGWADGHQPNIGWYVGYVERNKKDSKTEKEYYYFALNIDMKDGQQSARKIIVRKILAELKVI